MSDPQCLFCRIVAAEIPATLVYQDDAVVAFKDISPQAPVHILLVPRLHVAGLNDLEPGHASLVGSIALAAAKIAQEQGIASTGYRLVSNCGNDAGQTVHHLHFHLMGGKSMTGRMG